MLLVHKKIKTTLVSSYLIQLPNHQTYINHYPYYQQKRYANRQAMIGVWQHHDRRIDGQR